MTETRRKLTPRFRKALVYAFKLHRKQYRKQGKDDTEPPVPYISHLLAVASLVLEHGGDEDEAIAALLHDGPEDQGGQKTLDKIRKRFGDKVADIVEGCSDTLVEDRKDKEDWGTRKKNYLAHLGNTESESVLLVSMADKVHNIRSILADYRRIGEQLWQRFTGGRDGTLGYYRKLLETYRSKGEPRIAALLAEFERAYEELDRRANNT